MEQQDRLTTAPTSPSPSPLSPSPSMSDSSLDDLPHSDGGQLGAQSASRPGSPSAQGEPMHTDDSVVCLWEDCGKVYTHLPTLIGHMHDTHIGTHKSNYTCEWATCQRRGLAQTSRFALISHIRSHTGEKPFTCPRPECDKSFTRSDALAKHMRLQHQISPPAPGRGGNRKRKRGDEAQPSSSSAAAVAAGAANGQSSSIAEGSGFGAFKVEPQSNNADHLLLSDPNERTNGFDRSRRGRHSHSLSDSPVPPLPPREESSLGEDGYLSSSSDTLPAHLRPHYVPETNLVLGRSRALVMYLLMKAKHRYALEQHEHLLEELRVAKAELKKQKDEKEAALDKVLAGVFGKEAEPLVLPLQPPPGVIVENPPPPTVEDQDARPGSRDQLNPNPYPPAHRERGGSHRTHADREASPFNGHVNGNGVGNGR